MDNRPWARAAQILPLDGRGYDRSHQSLDSNEAWGSSVSAELIPGEPLSVDVIFGKTCNQPDQSIRSTGLQRAGILPAVSGSRY